MIILYKYRKECNFVDVISVASDVLCDDDNYNNIVIDSLIGVENNYFISTARTRTE